MKIEQIVTRLKSELSELQNAYRSDINDLLNKIKNLVDESSNFDNNWLGQWASPSYNIYGGFTRNGEEISIDVEQIHQYIEEQANIKIEDIQNQIPPISKAYRDFQDKLVTELSIIKGNVELEPECEILDKIESEDWGISVSDYVKMKRPRTVYTYDPSTIMNKGLKTPPHIAVGGELMSLFSTLASTEIFEKNSKRLLRQLEIKYSIEENTSSSNTDFIINIVNSFHNVARQLQNRYDKRDTITINDEYDVQDLLHSLLKIGFDDIRPEEYTPSYAGSSTRVDFLLKKEKILIEVKKTRKGLSDKAVGDQLILDSQHYKVHPDCKHLICFVYDPENRIQNPRGLEEDLNRLSTEELIVEVFIRP
jgi:hypothetical protein